MADAEFLLFSLQLLNMYHTCTDPLCQRLIVRDGNEDHIMSFDFL